LATSPGALTALAAVTARGARWAWLPRRPGELGALQAGACPAGSGRDTLAQLAALATGELQALVVAGLELADLPDPAAAAAALDQAIFVVSIEQRLSDTAQHADVVLPVALLEETSGTFVNWELRELPVTQVVRHPRSPMTDIRVLAALAEALDQPLGFRTPAEAAAALARHPVMPAPAGGALAHEPQAVAGGTTLLATWRELLDDARLIDGEAALLASARPVAARLHPATAQRLGLADAQRVRLSPPGRPGAGPVFDLLLDPTLVEGVVWAPSRARGSNLAVAGLAAGQPVDVTKEAAA
jgi:NADH-quinone oxidoreductase subunit G